MNEGMEVRQFGVFQRNVFSVAGPEPMAGEEKGNGFKKGN